VRLHTGEVVARQVVVVGPRLTARSAVLDSLGLAPVEIVVHGRVIGASYPSVDPTGATSVPGVWVAGNVADPKAQVIVAAAAGLTAGATINADLIEEDARAAVRSRDRARVLVERE
jgi:thioredoxin reductase